MCKLDIARTYNVSLRTVHVIENQEISGNLPLKRTRKSNNVKNIFSRAIVALTKTQGLVSCRKVANKISATLSRSTIRRNLISLGYKYLPCKFAIILTESQKKERVKIVKKYITQRIDFHKVVFTDVSRFSLDGNDNSNT